MAEKQSDEIQKFWKEREERHGGVIEFQSYAALIGEAGSGKVNGRGGLCYQIGDRIYFEDFEKHNALMALFNKRDDNYEKTEISFLVEDVIEVRKVSEKWGMSCIEDGALEEGLPSLTGIKSLFIRGFTMIRLKNRPALIMEIMNVEGLQKRLS